MKGLEKMVQRILSDAEKESKKVIRDAKGEVEKRKSSAKENAKAEAEKILSEGKREAEKIEHRVLASARLKTRQLKLNTQESLIQDAFSKAMDELPNLRKDKQRYQKIMGELVKAGGIAIGGEELEIQILKEDKKFLPKATVHDLTKKISKSTGNETSLKISTSLKNASGGVVVQKADGSVKCDNTFEARLRRLKHSLRSKTAEILFKS
ncbi:MAG: V-type ATP synthase subunit E family protein [Candidatus Hadarchaeota archaeon]|nr:V-type ATP synthase subunit E family protein [Candidatus Hadarchaeota archaeon]